MKLYRKLFIALFVPLLSVSEHALSQPSAMGGHHFFQGDQYPARSAYKTPYPGYGDPSQDFPIVGGGRWPEGVAGSAYGSYGDDPYRLPLPNHYPGQGPGSAYPSYPRSDGEGGFRWDPNAQPGVPDIRKYGYSGQGAPPRQFAPTATPGYRFRGDLLPGPRGWNALSGQPVYRFRPLTEQEYQRMATGTGWRPRPQEPVGMRFNRGDLLPPDVVYGYQPDSLFRDYYGPRR